MKLKRELGPLDVFSIGSGAMIAGLFIMPGLAYGLDGPASIISFFIAGLLATAGMLSEGELASAMPKAGGAYFYVTRSMGPAVGTVYGMTTWMSIALKTAFFMSMTAFLGFKLMGVAAGPVWEQVAASGLCILFVILNILGVKKAGRIQSVLFFGILVILGILTVRGIPCISVANFDPFVADGAGFLDVFAAAGFVFISFAGILKMGSIAEEVKDPGKTVPLAMILSLIVVMIIYMIVIFVTEGILPAKILIDNKTPLTSAAEACMGRGGFWLLSITAILALLSAANSGVMSAARYPLAAARDQVLPEFLSRINNRFKTPHVAVIFTGFLVIAAICLPVKMLVKAASGVFILSYILSCLSIIILRESHLQNYQPQFKAPLYPWIQVVGILGYGFLLVLMGVEVLLLCTIMIVGGFFIYWFYGRLKATREYALLHLIERLTTRDSLTEHGLETELKDIIRERDEITHDRFDHLIEDSPIIDIEHRIEADDFFQLISEEMSEGSGHTAEELKEKFQERESASSTAITPTIAIPHTVIEEGEGIFKCLLVRCRKGIHLSEKAPEVDAAFVLLSTRDERNFHLRALTAIAQIVQDAHFEKKWLKAKSKEVLRDIILLGERRRHH